MIKLTKLCLGTVQFGMKYGINNQVGQPSEEECFQMMDMSIEKGIDTIDTARAYGTAELVVGNYIKDRKLQGKVNIISKLRPNVIEPNEQDIYSVVRSELEGSLNRLGVSNLQGYLLHTPEYVYNEKIVDSLYRLKDEGLIDNLGVSIYNMTEGFEAIRKGMDYVQLPYSVLDQRGYYTEFISEAKKAGMTVYVRSAFLQGLFMMDYGRVPDQVAKAKPYLNYLDSLMDKYNVDKVELLLQFVKMTEGIDYLVFGVDNIKQLSENIHKFNKVSKIDNELIMEIRKHFSDVEESIILPSLWSNGKKAE